MSAWMYLAAAIVLEVIGTILLKLSDGFEKWQWGRSLDRLLQLLLPGIRPRTQGHPRWGVAYALWAGIGILAVTMIGFVVFREQLGFVQLACIALIAIGAVGLRLTTTAAA